MAEINIKVGDFKLPEKRLKAWVLFGAQEPAYKFRDYVRANYLSGPSVRDWKGLPISKKTGHLYDSYNLWTNKKKGQITVRPGVGDNKVNFRVGHWLGTDLDFPNIAWRSYSLAEKVEKGVKANFDKMLERYAEENSGVIEVNV